MAVNGSAGGGGMSLACAGDLVLAGESAKFTMAYTRIGLTPDGSSTYYLPRIIGLRRTMELALTNRTLTAREAEALGLVTRVVPDDQLIAQAEASAERTGAWADARLRRGQAAALWLPQHTAARADGTRERMDRRHGADVGCAGRNGGVRRQAGAEIQRPIKRFVVGRSQRPDASASMQGMLGISAVCQRRRSIAEGAVNQIVERLARAKRLRLSANNAHALGCSLLCAPDMCGVRITFSSIP